MANIHVLVSSVHVKEAVIPPLSPLIPPYFHHGFYTTLRQAILGHTGEVRFSRHADETIFELKAMQSNLNGWYR